ncbi:MAG: hypothetical protein JSV55_12960, partial [Deltaproteobacteria bacterium]
MFNAYQCINGKGRGNVYRISGIERGLRPVTYLCDIAVYVIEPIIGGPRLDTLSDLDPRVVVRAVKPNVLISGCGVEDHLIAEIVADNAFGLIGAGDRTGGLRVGHGTGDDGP